MKKTGYERQEKESTFWTIDKKGDIDNCYDVNTNADKMYNTANYYSDKTVAINNARADNLMRQLRRFAVENNDKEVDWTNRGMPKYYVVYDYERKELYLPHAYDVRTFAGVYFSSEEVAQKAIDAFYDELMWYFTEYCDHIVYEKDESIVEGCDLCNSGRLDIFGIEDNLICITNGVDGFTEEQKFKFCPKCGRKLVSENE